MDSFRYTIVRSATQVAAEIELLDYGRWRDMRRLHYRGMPPIDTMEFFVSKLGEGSFAFVPGYNADRRVPTVPNAVRRIVAGISFSKKGRTVTRGYTGTWYNTTKAEMINMAKARLAQRTSEWLAWQMKYQLENRQE